MKAVKKSIATSSRPIFYDPSGKRWRHFLEVTGALILVTVGIVAWIIPSMITPEWRPPVNVKSDYPRQLIATADLKDIPVIGDIEHGIMNRVVLVKNDGLVMNLVDPYTNDTIRPATENERNQIGDASVAIDHYGQPADHQLILTFDDGPDSQYTPMILDILSREKVPATFFNLGENIAGNTDVFRRIIHEGHMVGNHTVTHLDFNEQSDIRNREELVGNDRMIRAAANYETRLFRIPKGDPDHNALALLQAQQLGFLPFDDDVDSLDWKIPPGQDIPVPKLDGKGHVVLMHDGGGDRSATVRMLPKLIAEAKSMGYTFTTAASLIPSQYIPRSGIQPTLADKATLHGVQLIWVAPKRITGWLFWFGVGSLTIMSVLYLALALISQCLQSRRRWPDYSDEKLPYVSVVLSAYNEEKVIRKTLSELRRSDYPTSKIEVIAIDDGSKDRTLSIMEDFARDWPQLRVISQTNSGKSSAINKGISAASGEVIVTMDADTLFRPETIRMLARHFVKNTHHRHRKPVGAVAGHVKVGNRLNIITAWQSLEYISGICVTRMAEGMIDAISIVPGACSAWRRDALLQIEGFSESTLAEDADATLMLQRLGYKICQENKAVADTEAPETIRTLAMQRLRWTYGNIQALYKHRAMLLRPKYGMLGIVALPYSFLSLVVPLAFMPMTVVVAVMSLVDGNWKSVVLFSAFVALIHLLISTSAIIMARERAWHLLVVPIYRIIYEPLRAYLLYASLIRVIKGTVVKWNKLERTNNAVVHSAGLR